MLMGGGRGVAVPIPCPFCNAADSELVSLFGSQLLLSQFRCTACGSYFEGLREGRWETPPVAPASGGIADDSRTEH
jgi:transposase-like protein